MSQTKEVMEWAEEIVLQAKENPEISNLRKHRPLTDQILILPIDFDEDDTIVSPRQYEDKPEWGLVVGVGPGRMTESGVLIEPVVKVGDVVVFGQYASTVVRSHGVDFFYVRNEDIMSVYAPV